jgi:hypothetical protein
MEHRHEDRSSEPGGIPRYVPHLWHGFVGGEADLDRAGDLDAGDAAYFTRDERSADPTVADAAPAPDLRSDQATAHVVPARAPLGFSRVIYGLFCARHRVAIFIRSFDGHGRSRRIAALTLRERPGSTRDYAFFKKHKRCTPAVQSGRWVVWTS